MRQVPQSSPLFMQQRHRRTHHGASGVSRSSSLLRNNNNNKKERLRVTRRETISVSSSEEEQPQRHHHHRRRHDGQQNRRRSGQDHQTKVNANNRLLRRLLKHKTKSDDTQEESCYTLQSSDSSLSTKKPKKTVSFGKVHVREHARMLVDHPSCPDGLSLGLDWMHGERVTIMDVDLFERSHKRGGQGKARRLQSFERKVILKVLAGYQEAELMNAYFNHHRQRKIRRSKPAGLAGKPS